MFRTLIYPSSGACDCAVELPNWSCCSWSDVCWSFGVVGLEWYPCCRLKHNQLCFSLVIQQNSRKILMVDILMSETCWAHKKWNKLACYIKLVCYSSTITMMHGPVNISSYHTTNPHLKQVFQSVYRNELETRLTHKPWKQEIAKIPDWPRIKAVAEFRLCVWHDCLGTYLHGIGICPDTYCMLCSLCGPTDKTNLGRCNALLNRTECERYWEARTKMMENWLCLFTITILVTTSYH